MQAGIILNGVLCGLVLTPVPEKTVFGVDRTTETDTEKPKSLTHICDHLYEKQTKHIDNGHEDTECFLAGANDGATELSEKHFQDPSDEQRECMEMSDTLYVESQTSSYASVKEYNTCRGEKLDGDLESQDMLRKSLSNCKDNGHNAETSLIRSQKQRKHWISLKPLTNPSFLMFIFSNLLTELALSVPFAFLPDLMLMKGFDRQQAVWVIFTTGRIILSDFISNK